MKYVIAKVRTGRFTTARITSTGTVEIGGPKTDRPSVTDQTFARAKQAANTYLRTVDAK